jgi:hypothetical protein
MPGQLEQSDFLWYYSVGRVARDSGLSHVYDLDLELAAQSQTAGVELAVQDVFPPNHPPFVFPVLMLLAGLSYRSAYLVYLPILLAIVAAGLPTLAGTLRQQGWSRSQIWTVLIGLLLFEPFFISLLKGQDTAILLLGGLLWISGLARADDRLAGLGLALTLVRPQIALMMALPFLFRRIKVFWWFVAGGTLLALYSFAQIGWTGTQELLHNLTLSSAGGGYRMNQEAMFNFLGLVIRLDSGLNSNLVHGLALLEVPVLCLLLAGARSGRLPSPRSMLIPMYLSLLLLVSDLWDPIRYPAAYFLMFLLPAWAWWADKNGRLETPAGR